MSDPKKNYGIVQALLEGTVKPAGPYLLVVWTQFPNEAAALSTFLDERLVDVPTPVAVVSLDKADRLNDEGKLIDPITFVSDLKKLVADQPQFAALLNWEHNVLSAAAGTVSEIIGLTRPKPNGHPPTKLTQVLAQLATAAVGHQNVEVDRFRAVNKTLLPILADRIGVLRGNKADKAVWATAFAAGDLEAGLTSPITARLNRFLHVEHPPEVTGASQRGSVVELPNSLIGSGFEKRFGIMPDSKEARKDFAIKEKSPTESWSWRLVQVQAPCDEAQKHPGPLPFVLAAEVGWANKGHVADARWGSPCFSIEDEHVLLVLNSRYLIDFSVEDAATFAPVYRLREQIMSEVSHHLHSQGARPGIIRFGK